jgi:uncharacterized membrane protein
MTRLLATYAATFVTMLLLDMLWLGVIARSLYQAGIGHLMADKPNIPVAALFYLMFPAGLVIFAVQPQAGNPGWAATAGMAALFGFFAYATYDLTNLATLRDWPWSVALVDMAWGAAVSAASATVGKLVLDRMTT